METIISNEQLIKDSINGHYDSYAKLVERYSNMVYAVAFSRTRDSYQAEDIAQDVFVKAWLNLSKLDEESKFSAWIIAMTKNKCIDYYRKNSRKQEKNFSEDFSVLESNQKTKLTDLLWESLDRLDENTEW